VAADPAAAAQRFAKWAIRCCVCGKVLTEETSKVVGIGPECRKGRKAEWLAEVLTPKVARIHAAAIGGAK
jgi:hypothetical protein